MLKSQIQLSQYDRCLTQLSKEFKQCRPFQIYQSGLGFSRFFDFRWLRNDSNNMLEPIWSSGGILPTALVDILETTASEDNGDDDEAGEKDDDYVFDSDDEE